MQAFSMTLAWSSSSLLDPLVTMPSSTLHHGNTPIVGDDHVHQSFTQTRCIALKGAQVQIGFDIVLETRNPLTSAPICM